jgi:glycosyltransferase involved in cell wall biosynthesis
MSKNFVDSPLVSIIMPAYNEEDFVEEAVESILRQTYQNFIFIIIDDGSTDKTHTILEKFADLDKRIILYQNPKNIGYTNSLNYGLSLTNSKYIARQDADDISVSNRIEKQISFLEANPTVGLIGSSMEIISSSGKPIITHSLPISNEEIHQKILQENCFAHGSVIFRKECIDQVGEYDTRFEPAEDYDLWLRISEHFEVANLPDILYQYRINQSSISIQKAALQIRNSILAQNASIVRRGISPFESINNQESNQKLIITKTIDLQIYQLYLFFLSGNFHKINFSIVIPHDPEYLEYLFMKVTSYASTVSQTTKSFQNGIWFIDAVSKILTPKNKPSFQKRHMKAKYAINEAFDSHRQNKPSLTIRNVTYALIHNPSWIKNRGVLSIIFDALVGKQLARIFKRRKLLF